MKRRHRSSHPLAELAALRLRALFGTSAAGDARPETHRGVLHSRASASGPPFHSHLYFELDGDVSLDYQEALAAEFARCLELARARAGSAFCMLGEADLLPTMQWSIEHPARARVDIPATGGARLWAVERLVCSCFEHAVEQCAVTPQGEAGRRRRPRLAPGVPSS